MDFKGVAWAETIFGKFEAMCLEVEDSIQQDTVKYVENQVHKVGVTVKKFYAEIMQDLLPPSDQDIVKATSHDLSITPHAHSDMKEKPKAMLENIELKSTENKVAADEDVEKKSSRIELGEKSDKSSLCDSKEDCISSLDITRMTLSSDSVKSCNSVEEVNANDSMVEALDEGTGDEFDIDGNHNDKLVEQIADILKQDEQSRLEESCVMVEGDMLHPFLPETTKQKSYKKKIREAFLAKLRSRKQQHDKLLVENGNQSGTRGKEMVISSSDIVSNSMRSQGQNFSDSDWELL